MLHILMGKSGTGKDALMRKLIEKDHFIPLVSMTTRPMREGEKDGREYNFVTKEEFLKDLDDNKFIEYRSYNTLVDNIPDTWYYGSPKYELDDNKNYVVILDVEGTESFLSYYKGTPLLVTYIETPDELREERASLRGGFNKAEWDRRVVDDNRVFAPEIVSKIADVELLNKGTIDDLYNNYKLAAFPKIAEEEEYLVD